MSPEMFRELRGFRARLVRRAAPIGTMSPLWDQIDEIDAWTGYAPNINKAFKSAEDLRDSLINHFKRWPDDDGAVS